MYPLHPIDISGAIALQEIGHADQLRLAGGIEIAQQLCVSVVPSLNDSRGTEVIAIVAVMTAISTIAVILRLIGRKVSAAPYGADDVLIVVALILTYGLNINEIIAVHYGFGRHQLMLSLNYISKFLLNDWCIQIIFASAISVTRLSLLVFYHRLFPVKRFTIVAIVTGFPSYWNKAIIGHCLDEHTLSWSVTGTELATNMIMLILPIPWLWRLHLEWTKKLALIGIFMLGCFVCVSCVVRFPLLATLVQTDASWTLVPAGVWIIVECNIGIASVCLPLMRPLISVELSALSSKLPFVKSRRTASPFTDEETSIGKLYEKPYDGPSLVVQPQRIPPQNDPQASKPISGSDFASDKAFITSNEFPTADLASKQAFIPSDRPSIPGLIQIPTSVSPNQTLTAFNPARTEAFIASTNETSASTLGNPETSFSPDQATTIILPPNPPYIPHPLNHIVYQTHNSDIQIRKHKMEILPPLGRRNERALQEMVFRPRLGSRKGVLGIRNRVTERGEDGRV
ncbi:MAG: hypothetical protein Q9220_004971 [cf. Caloplaca sp. 1 TL-2023]